MKILLVTHCYPTATSQAGIFIEDRRKELNDKGHEASVVVLSKYGGGWRTLSIAMREKKPDIVEAHWIYPSGFVVAIICAWYGVQYNVTCHGKDVHMVANWFWRLVARWVCAGAFGVRVVSQYLLDELHKYKVIPEHIGVVSPMPIDTIFERSRGKLNSLLRLNMNPPLIICIGNYIPRKRHKLLISALNMVRDTGYEFRAEFYGDGDCADLIDYVNERLMTRWITFSPSIPRHELVEVMKRAAMLVHPAVNEGYGMVVAEALAIGLPVIGADSGAMREHKGVILFQADNKYDLALAIGRMLKERRSLEHHK